MLYRRERSQNRLLLLYHVFLLSLGVVSLWLLPIFLDTEHIPILKTFGFSSSATTPRPSDPQPTESVTPPPSLPTVPSQPVVSSISTQVESFDDHGYFPGFTFTNIVWDNFETFRFYNTPQDIFENVQKNFDQYRMHHAGRISETSFRLERHPEILNLSTCDKVIDETTFVLAPWVTENMFHVHNDNLLPMFWNLMHEDPTLNPTNKQVLLLHDPHERTIPFWRSVLEKMFARVKTFQDLGSGRVCFRRLRWGRGPTVLYERTRFPALADTVPAFRDWIYKAFDVQPNTGTAYHNPPRILYTIRHDAGRSLDPSNRDELFKVLREAGFEVSPCCKDWSVPAVLKEVARSDIVMGPHGAGHLVSIYLHPRGQLVELKVKYGATNCQTERFALFANLTNIMTDSAHFDAATAKIDPRVFPELAQYMKQIVANPFPDPPNKPGWWAFDAHHPECRAWPFSVGEEHNFWDVQHPGE